jgi:hypothetical protein
VDIKSTGSSIEVQNQVGELGESLFHLRPGEGMSKSRMLREVLNPMIGDVTYAFGALDIVPDERTYANGTRIVEHFATAIAK